METERETPEKPQELLVKEETKEFTVEEIELVTTEKTTEKVEKDDTELVVDVEPTKKIEIERVTSEKTTATVESTEEVKLEYMSTSGSIEQERTLESAGEVKPVKEQIENMIPKVSENAERKEIIETWTQKESEDEAKPTEAEFLKFTTKNDKDELLTGDEVDVVVVSDVRDPSPKIEEPPEIVVKEESRNTQATDIDQPPETQSIDKVQPENMIPTVSENAERKEIIEDCTPKESEDEAKPTVAEFLKFTAKNDKDGVVTGDKVDDIVVSYVRDPSPKIEEPQDIVAKEESKNTQATDIEQPPETQSIDITQPENMTPTVPENVETKEVIEDCTPKESENGAKPTEAEFLKFTAKDDKDGLVTEDKANYVVVSDVRDPSQKIEEPHEIVVKEKPRNTQATDIEQPAESQSNIEKPPEAQSKLDTKNFWWSIYVLIIGYGLWLTWAMVPVRLQITGFDLGGASYTAGEIKTMLWSLPAVAGLSGATMRIVNGLIYKIGGGRNVIAVTAVSLMIPAIGLAITAESQHASLLPFCIFASLSGIAGGFFVTYMLYIGDGFDYKLGVRDCYGMIGVVLALILIPIVVCLPFGVGFELTHDDWMQTGDKSYVYMAGWIWVPLLLISLIGAIYFMTQQFEDTFHRVKMIMLIMCYGLAGCVFIIIGGSIPGYTWLIWVMLPFSISVPFCLLSFCVPTEIKDDVEKSYEVLKIKYTWIMGAMSLVSLGSFLGFAFSLPKLIIDVFGYLPTGFENPKAPSVSTWAFIGPLVGVLTMLIMKRLSNSLGSGSRVVTISAFIQIVFAALIGISLILARNSDTPDEYFVFFILSFIFMFIVCAIGIVGLFKQMSTMASDKEEQIDFTLWIVSCIGCYGAFLVPALFGLVMENHCGSGVMFGIATFYCMCFIMHFHFFELNDGVIR